MNAVVHQNSKNVPLLSPLALAIQTPHDFGLRPHQNRGAIATLLGAGATVPSNYVAQLQTVQGLAQRGNYLRRVEQAGGFRNHERAHRASLVAMPSRQRALRETIETIHAGADGARAVLKAADRFGVTRLKQLAEIELATRHLSVESAADLLLLADAHSCPQLKESASELFVSKAPEVMATESSFWNERTSCTVKERRARQQ